MKLGLRIGLCVFLLVGLGLATDSGLRVQADEPLTAGDAVDSRLVQTGATEEMTLRNLSSYHFVQLRGGWEWLDSADHTKLARTRFNDAVIEGTFVGSWLELKAVFKSQVFELSLDGQTPERLTAPASTTPDPTYFRLTSGMAWAKHTFMLRLADRVGGDLVAQSFRTDGNWLRGQFSHRPRILGFGSSTMDFCGITWQLSQKLGWEAVNRGIGGTTVVHEGQYRVASDLISQHPETILINYGSNDWFSNIPLSQFKPAYLNMLDQIGRGVPNANIVVMGLFPRKNGNETSRPLYNQAIRDAISASVVAGHTRYVEVTDYDYNNGSKDGTHPNINTVNTVFVPQLLPFFDKLHPIITSNNSDDDNP